MHEMSLIANALNLIEQTIAQSRENISKVNVVTLKVGRMANCIPDALKAAFAGLRQDTIFAEAKLELVFESVQAQCLNCGSKFSPQVHFCQCPQCHEKEIKILSGAEVYVASIDY